MKRGLKVFKPGQGTCFEAGAMRLPRHEFQSGSGVNEWPA